MNTFKKILPHIVVWAIVFVIVIITNHSFVDYDETERSLFFREHAPVWLVYVLVFYVSYSLLIPFLLFRKKVVPYVFLTLVLFLGSFWAINRSMTDMYVHKLDRDIISISQRDDVDDPKVDRRLKRISSRRNEVMSNRNSVNIFAPYSGHITYTLVIVIFFALGIRTLQRWQYQEKQLRNIKQQQTESELIYLKQQINPHFLFNALNSIYSLVIPYSDEASSAVLKLSSILRYMLYETDKPLVPLEKEVELIDDYLSLQHFKFTDKTKINFKYDGDLESHRIPPLILVPFIENAFKYGADNVHDSFITIRVETNDNELSFTVENRVVCRKDDRDDGGIGINNIRRRLDLIYPGQYNLFTKEESDIFYVSLQMPLS